jgi:hypothetical protein
MKGKLFLFIGLAALSLLALSTIAMTGLKLPVRQDQASSNLVQTVREATEPYKSVEEAEADGYGLFLGCVSGPQEGAMGVHYPNGSLVGDGALDPMHPEVLVYELKNGRHDLVAVEYLVLADDWNAHNASPPVLMGQVFNYVGSPNRYGMPAFYELHVWAWKTNPKGVFADWNPGVTCEGYNP